MAAALVLAQLRAHMALPGYAHAPGLGLLYITDHYAAEAQDILDHLSAELPEVTDWVGTVGVGICANNAEYFDEPALAVMLCDLSPDQYRVFSGVAPLPAAQGDGGFTAHTALLHADDGALPDLAELIGEVAERTVSGYVFGGLASSRGAGVQFAHSCRGASPGRGGVGSGVFLGGFSGVAFGSDVALVSRVTQGVRPVSREHVIGQSSSNVVLRLDERPALEVLLEDLAISLDDPQTAVPKLRATLVGLTAPSPQAGVAKPSPGDSSISTGSPHPVHVRGQFGDDVLVRHLIGLDPNRQGVAIADHVPEGGRLTFCERHVQAAKADLMRICAEIREELEPETVSLDAAHAMAGSEAESVPHLARRMAGAVYVSCNGRGGPHFGGPSAELQIVRRALGDVPLVGFFASGEIAHNRLYGYTGVLTVFTMPAVD